MAEQLAFNQLVGSSNLSTPTNNGTVAQRKSSRLLTGRSRYRNSLVPPKEGMCMSDEFCSGCKYFNKDVCICEDAAEWRDSHGSKVCRYQGGAILVFDLNEGS